MFKYLRRALMLASLATAFAAATPAVAQAECVWTVVDASSPPDSKSYQNCFNPYPTDILHVGNAGEYGFYRFLSLFWWQGVSRAETPSDDCFRRIGDGNASHPCGHVGTTYTVRKTSTTGVKYIDLYEWGYTPIYRRACLYRLQMAGSDANPYIYSPNGTAGNAVVVRCTTY